MQSVWYSVTSRLESTSAPHLTEPPADRPITNPLRQRNFRIFLTGQAFAFTGVWVQRIAQDWLVLTLTNSPTDVGITTALQALPTLFFGLLGGMLADRYSKRVVLFVTAGCQAVLAATLAALVLSHQVRLWQLMVVATVLGCVMAVDSPTRQSLVSDIVGQDQLRPAIGLNSSAFQLGALIGPAISAALISGLGSGVAFLVNAITFCAPMSAMFMIRTSDLSAHKRAPPGAGQLREAIRYATSHAEIGWPIVLVGIVGAFTANIPVTLAAFAHSNLRSGAGGYGVLVSCLALGSLGGALVGTRRMGVGLSKLLVDGGVLSAAFVVAAVAPGHWAFAVAIVPVGAAAVLFQTGANSRVQLAALDSMRGRVMGIYMLVMVGCGAIGGPLLGYADESLSPRIGLLLSGVVPGTALTCVAIHFAHKHRKKNIRARGRPAASASPPPASSRNSTACHRTTLRPLAPQATTEATCLQRSLTAEPQGPTPATAPSPPPGTPTAGRTLLPTGAAATCHPASPAPAPPPTASRSRSSVHTTTTLPPAAPTAERTGRPDGHAVKGLSATQTRGSPPTPRCGPGHGCAHC